MLPRTFAPLALLSIVSLAATTGCDMIKFKGVVKTTTVVDGKETTKVREFDSLEEMPGALKESANDIADTTKELAKKLTEAPPPGEVKLKDLSPALDRFEGNERLNFLAKAKNPDGTPIEFKYVRIGVPSYDQFFQKSAELFALMYQLKQTTHRLREIGGAVLGKEPDSSASLSEIVEAALSAEPSSDKEGLVAELKELKEITAALAPMAVSMVQKVQELVGAGQQLIAGAPASITNPKTALHLDLIVKGLEQSLKVIAESGTLLKDVAKEASALV